MGSSLFGPSSASSLNVAPTSITNDASSILTARKKSRDYENSIYSYNQNEMLGAEDMARAGNAGGERKKSGSSSNSKGKEREKSEGSIYFLTDEARRDKSLECECGMGMAEKCTAWLMCLYSRSELSVDGRHHQPRVPKWQ